MSSPKEGPPKAADPPKNPMEHTLDKLSSPPYPEPDADRETGIAEYLEHHPDFFVRQPQALEQLVLPHSCGDAVSLVQYQVSVLRDKNHELRRRMQTLIGNARDNEKLSQRLHRLSLELLDCTSLGDIFAHLYQALHDDFQAEFATVKLYGTPAHAGDEGLAEFTEDCDTAAGLFASVFVGEKPVCGRFRDEQAQALFQEHASEILSGALLPLGGKRIMGGPLGLLAIGSRDPKRFHPGMGTLFLRQLGEVLSRVLGDYVERK